MRSAIRHGGFTLTETLLAVATLAVGLLFVAGTFMVGIHFSTVSTERTIAAVVAEEAFAKIGIYDVNAVDPNLVNPNRAVNLGMTIDPAVLATPDNVNMVHFEDLTFEGPNGALLRIHPSEFAYPSIIDPSASRQYYWSALCRRIDPDPNSGSGLVQVTVFICRKSAPASAYVGGAGRPIPMLLAVSNVGRNSLLTITTPDLKRWINDGYRIVDDATGRIYRVVERTSDQPQVVVLDVGWDGGPAGRVWVVPPPTTGGKGPCIAVYQKTMRF